MLVNDEYMRKNDKKEQSVFDKELDRIAFWLFMFLVVPACFILLVIFIRLW